MGRSDIESLTTIENYGEEYRIDVGGMIYENTDQTQTVRNKKKRNKNTRHKGQDDEIQSKSKQGKLRFVL